MNAAATPSTVHAPPCRLAVNGDDLTLDALDDGAYPRHEAGHERLRFQQREHPPDGVARWDAVRPVQPLAQPVLLRPAEVPALNESIGAADDRENAQDDDTA